jgi:hypothetical protein
MIKFTQDRRPHHGFTDVWVNPGDVMSICHLCGEHGDSRSQITLRNGDAYNVTDYASIVAEKINAALDKPETHYSGTALVDKPSTLNTELPRATFTC